MTLQELAATLSEDFGITKATAKGILDSVRWHINDLEEGEQLRWAKLGVFQRKTACRKIVFLKGKKYCSFPRSRIVFSGSRRRGE